jgi:hypothetical protein
MYASGSVSRSWLVSCGIIRRVALKSTVEGVEVQEGKAVLGYQITEVTVGVY